MRHYVLLVGVGSLLLFGCAEVTYVKAGATEADFEADKIACHDQVLMSPMAPAITSGQMGRPGITQGMATQSASAAARQEVDQCLRAKGWVPKSQTQ